MPLSVKVLPGLGFPWSLSAEGVRLAREVGVGMGPFAFVLASLVPRTHETALAMGFAVDETVEMGGPAWD